MSTKRLLLIVTITLCALLAFNYWKHTQVNYVNLPPKASGPWMAFGDSLTEGVGAAGGSDFPSLLGQALGISITNLGRSGDTTASGLARIEEAAGQNPSVVLLCLGGNDALNGVPTSQTFQNLGAIIDRFHQAGSFVVLIGIRSASLQDRNEEHFARLAAAKQVFYIPDILRGVAFKPIYLADAIHPNDAGYQQITKRLEKLLRPLLPKLRPGSG
jgi:lysophospholipase L1-like esterase